MIKINNVSINNLKNISIEIPINKYVCLVGKSGSGKSTLAVNVIYSGFYNKNINIDIDIKPFLFSQKVSIPSTNKTIDEYLGKRNGNALTDNLIDDIVKLLNLKSIDFNTNIEHLSLIVYNKVRFLKFLYSIDDEKLLIIDEIGSGLCHKEAQNIIKIYRLLIGCGFSIIGIEHSITMIVNSDHIIELGPDAGKDGGAITYSGNTTSYLNSDNLFSQTIKHNIEFSNSNSKTLKLEFEKLNYLTFKDISFHIPLNSLVCIAGTSGSGKTNLLKVVNKLIDKSSGSWKNRIGVECSNINGKNYIRRPHTVTQDPIGSNCSSIPLTYIGLMDDLRDFYAENFKLKSGLFSFNGLGNCEHCNGKGYEAKKYNREIVYQKCILCDGKRYNQEILKKIIDNYSIGDILLKTTGECIDIFDKWNISNHKLKFLKDMGLSYLMIGQPTITLSGGESQRVKIAKELSKKLGDRSVYLLDTPSRGLHVSDIKNLTDVFQLLIKKNNTVVIADNHPFMIMKSDYIIYLEDSEIKYFGYPKELPTVLKEKLGLVVSK